MRVITKDSKLEGISAGEKVEIIGICSEKQKEQGKVLAYDAASEIMVILTRASGSEIHSTHYGRLSHEIIAGSPVVVKKWDVDYDEFDAYLKGVEL
jgi:hypothetical protein